MIFYTYVPTDVCKIWDIYTNLVALNMIEWDFIIKKVPQTVSKHKVTSLHCINNNIINAI